MPVSAFWGRFILFSDPDYNGAVVEIMVWIYDWIFLRFTQCKNYRNPFADKTVKISGVISESN